MGGALQEGCDVMCFFRGPYLRVAGIGLRVHRSRVAFCEGGESMLEVEMGRERLGGRRWGCEGEGSMFWGATWREEGGSLGRWWVGHLGGAIQVS